MQKKKKKTYETPRTPRMQKIRTLKPQQTPEEKKHLIKTPCKIPIKKTFSEKPHEKPFKTSSNPKKKLRTQKPKSKRKNIPSPSLGPSPTSRAFAALWPRGWPPRLRGRPRPGAEWTPGLLGGWRLACGLVFQKGLFVAVWWESLCFKEYIVLYCFRVL